MDVQATTPTEVMQAENQASIDALRRLAGTRDALARLCEALPSLASPDATAANRLLTALPGFWASRGAEGDESPRATLGRLLASAMKEEAALRGLDGTLGTQAASLAARVASLATPEPPTGLHVRELLLGGVPHAGSLIVVDDATPGLALLFTAHGGWEAFDSLDRLLESTRRRLLESVDADDGTGMDSDAFAEAKRVGTVGSQDMAGPVFDTLAGRMIDVQHHRVALAVDNHALDSDRPDAAERLDDRVRVELSATAMLDIGAIERLREVRLIEASVANRLSSVPEAVRTAWYEARDNYNEALATAAVLRSMTGVQPQLTLRAFASRELATRLAALGIDESPEGITIEVTPLKVLPDPLATLEPLPGLTEKRRLPLIDFAAQNIARFSTDSLHAADEQGASLRHALPHTAIRDMVRDLDLANRYQDHIEDHLRRGSTGALARKLAITVQAAMMRMEVVDARLSYYLPDEPRTFIDDRDERGFRWVEAALGAPAGSRHVGGHDIVVSQLSYRQAALDGILVFAARAANSAPRMVMYTPGAPDGLTFREFESRQDAAKRFLHHPAFREYLLDRLPAEFATVSVNGATRRFAGDRLAHWVLGAGGDAAYTLTAEPFEEREVNGDFFAVSHDAVVEKFRRDARFLARSTADADSDAWFGYLQGRLSTGSGAKVVSAALSDLPTSLSRMMQASWRFYDHMKAGDTGQAFVAFTEGYTNALNLVVPPYVRGYSVAGAIVRSRAAKLGVARTGVSLTPLPVRFDERYAVRNASRTGTPDAEGIIRVRGQSYIEQDRTRFLVRHDSDYGLWRLAPPRGAIDARFSGPLIERIDGAWTFAQDAGLRGGMRRFRERLNRLVIRNEVAPPVPAAPEAAPPGRVAPGPNPPPRMALPAVMEPYRAEITAVMADNPSALALVRADGTHMKVVVQPRSALILDPHLHPDIAELSAHQRRVLLHEVDSRFPLAGERAQVIDARAWSRQEGRRIPSRPSSPGISPGDDVQSPLISSSTGDPASPTVLPPLTAGQQARWDDAMAVARGAPRSPRGSVHPSGNTPTYALPEAELVPREEWPDRVWWFSDQRVEAEAWPGSGRQGVTLGNDAVWLGSADGLHTYPVSVLPPETPTGRLAEALGTSPVQQAGQRDALGYALQIDLTRLREPWRQVSRTHVVIGDGADFELYRRVLPNGEYRYTMQSGRPIRIASTHITNAGRRGEAPTALAPARH